MDRHTSTIVAGIAGIASPVPIIYFILVSLCIVLHCGNKIVLSIVQIEMNTTVCNY